MARKIELYKKVIETQDLSIGYRKRRATITIAHNIAVALKEGELICLLGPNGVGKSTLMRTIAGLQTPLKGSVKLNNKPLSEYSNKEIAKHLALVLTEKISGGNLKVADVLALGRYPYLGWLGALAKEDKSIIRRAVKSTDIGQFLKKPLHQLSDGEQQKVMIARALVQDTALIMLDEPTAHLDLPNRISVMRLLRQMAHDYRKAIVVATHELDLALQASDKIWLMMPNQSMMVGTPEDLVLSGDFERAFKKNGFDFNKDTGTFTVNRTQNPWPVALSGTDIACFWTKRALEREGFEIVPHKMANIQVKATESHWTLHQEGREAMHVTTVSALIAALKEFKAQ